MDSNTNANVFIQLNAIHLETNPKITTSKMSDHLPKREVLGGG